MIIQRKAIDYAGRFSPELLSALRSHGISVVIRYVGQVDNPKCITRSELAALHGAGLDVCFVYETTADWMRGSVDAGRIAAGRITSYMQAIGGPARPTVYLAADFDVSSSDLQHLASCCRGAALSMGADHVGIYGGYFAVHGLLSMGAARYGWQTYAWSHGLWDERAGIRQVAGTPYGKLPVGYDADEVLAADVGQWPAVKPVPMHTVLLDVPADIYMHAALWSAAWPHRAAWKVADRLPAQYGKRRIAMPMDAYQHQELWVKSWRSRRRWEV